MCTVKELRYIIIPAEGCGAVFACVKRPDHAGCTFVLMMIVAGDKINRSAASRSIRDMPQMHKLAVLFCCSLSPFRSAWKVDDAWGRRTGHRLSTVVTVLPPNQGEFCACLFSQEKE